MSDDEPAVERPETVRERRNRIRANGLADEDRERLVARLPGLAKLADQFKDSLASQFKDLSLARSV